MGIRRTYSKNSNLYVRCRRFINSLLCACRALLFVAKNALIEMRMQNWSQSAVLLRHNEEKQLDYNFFVPQTSKYELQKQNSYTFYVKLFYTKTDERLDVINCILFYSALCNENDNSKYYLNRAGQSFRFVAIFRFFVLFHFCQRKQGMVIREMHQTPVLIAEQCHSIMN